MKCIVCDRSITLIEDLWELPRHAVVFRSSGNYGSRIWDELHRRLMIYVCDECLVAKKKWVREIVETRVSRPPSTVKPWEPDEV